MRTYYRLKEDIPAYLFAFDEDILEILPQFKYEVDKTTGVVPVNIKIDNIFTKNISRSKEVINQEIDKNKMERKLFCQKLKKRIIRFNGEINPIILKQIKIFYEV